MWNPGERLVKINKNMVHCITFYFILHEIRTHTFSELNTYACQGLHQYIVCKKNGDMTVYKRMGTTVKKNGNLFVCLC